MPGHASPHNPRPAIVEAVPLAKCYRLINHGPTVLVTAHHKGQSNVMAAAWNMALDFTPPKVAVVLDKSTYTRKLLLAEGSFALSVPSVAIADATFQVGSESAMETGSFVDKFAKYKLGAFAGETATAPLVEGCVAWLECRRIPEPHIEQTYDLFLGEVVAAWADSRVYSEGRWNFSNPANATLHHVAGGAFLVPSGEVVQGHLAQGKL
jgi:flavin reductase (DIM6/NTAB) family NADH-FMN oxidoreductase RutF